MSTDLHIPTDLSQRVQSLATDIVALLERDGATYTGGCRTFYTPQEWQERGEKYGEGSDLIVVYDGSDVAAHFSYDACYDRYDRSAVKDLASDYDTYGRCERMAALLKRHGFYSEEGTRWFSVVRALTVRQS